MRDERLYCKFIVYCKAIQEPSGDGVLEALLHVQVLVLVVADHHSILISRQSENEAVEDGL